MGARATLESKKFDLVSRIIATMDGKKDKVDSIKSSTRSAKSSSHENSAKSTKSDDHVKHVESGRDKAHAEKVVEAKKNDKSTDKVSDDQPHMESILKSIASLTEGLKFVRESQDDMVQCMLAAGGQPCLGKGKGRGKRSAPRDEEPPRVQPSKTSHRRETAPSVAKRARREEVDLNYRDSELDYSGDESDQEVAFTSDDIENQIDAFLQTACEPPARSKQPPLLPLDVPGPSGSQSRQPVSHVHDISDEELDASLSLFAQDLTTDEDMGPDINNQLADILTNLLAKKMPDEKVKSRIEENPPPRNVPLLHPPRVNECIWELMKAAPRSTDIRLRKIQVRLTRGLVGLARLAEVLLANKKKGTHPDMADCLNRCLQSFALLSNANYEISLRRRETLRSQLNPRYSRLCYPSTPVTSDLFGDDVQKLVEDITKVNKIGADIAQKYEYNYKNKNYNNNNKFGQSHRGGRGGHQGSFRGRRRDDKQSKNGRWRGNGQKGNKGQ